MNNYKMRVIQVFASLVNKTTNNEDLRYTLLQATKEGKKIHKELLKKQTDRNKKLLKDFSNEEINHMQKLLDKLLISSQNI